MASHFPGGGGGGGGLPADAGPSTSAPSRSPPEGLSPRDVHVLLVDDERLARMVVGSLLRKLEYRGEGALRRGAGWESARARRGRSGASLVARRGASPARAGSAGPCFRRFVAGMAWATP